jgi:hypothetical protein
MTKQVMVRAGGRAFRDIYLFQLKDSGESKNEWDLFK